MASFHAKKRLFVVLKRGVKVLMLTMQVRKLVHHPVGIFLRVRYSFKALLNHAGHLLAVLLLIRCQVEINELQVEFVKFRGYLFHILLILFIIIIFKFR